MQLLASGKTQTAEEEEVGTPGRWRVAADPSVGEEQGAGLPGTAVPGHPRSPGSS